MSLKKIVSFALGRRWLVLATLMLSVLMCEIYMRLPISGYQLEYEPDDHLVAVLRPNQVGYMWLGNMSFKSPLITINADGHRGKETDWHRPVVLTVGNSENMGIGVEEGEVWSSILEGLLRRERGLEVQVVNASHPGHGPYHQLVRLRRALERGSVSLVIVRVDLADRYFRPIENREVPLEMERAKMRKLIRQYTKGLPYLFNKAQAQLAILRTVLKSQFSATGQAHAYDTSAKDWRKMWMENKVWWSEMARMAAQMRIPIVFMVYDVLDRLESSVTEEGLMHSLSENSSGYVLRVGAAAFGLKSREAGELEREIKAVLTLERDQHANALQHKLLANAVYEFLLQKGLLRR